MPPRTFVCYICQREFGSASISIHEPQCLQKWRAQQDMLPPSQRLPEPKKPTFSSSDGGSVSNADREAANEAARQAAMASMAQCRWCGRKFSDNQRLAIHNKSCTEFKPAAPAPGWSPESIGISHEPSSPVAHTASSNPTQTEAGAQLHESNGSSPSKGPRSLVCYLCGTSHFQASLPIHLKTCESKFKEQNAMLPPEQRRPMPSMPSGIQRLLSGATLSEGEREQTNEESEAAYRSTMPKCGVCGRTFKDTERLAVHQKSCKSAGSDRKDSESNGFRQSHGRTPRMLVCYICSREYSSASLPIHQPQCLAKWRAENERLPPGSRRPEPKEPVPIAELTISHGNDDSIREAANEAAREAAKAAMVQCQFCGRRFASDRLAVHNRSCTSEKPGRPAPGWSAES